MGNNQNTTARVASGELAVIDPTTLVIDTNVRTDAALDRAFVASIGERGVIQPVIATRDEDGTIRVRDGQRRTLAAREAGLESIPVYVIGTDAEADAATIERVTDQLIANEHRTNLSAKERALGAQQLIDLGVSRTKVAKATSLGTTKAVDAAVATAKSTVAMSSLDAGLTLDQAAIIASFEDNGDTDAVRMLCDAAAEGTFDHKAAQLAATAAERAAHREAAAPLIEAGYELLERRPYYYGADSPAEVARLVHGETGAAVTEDEIATLTADRLVAYIDTEIEEVWLDDDGEAVDDSLIDWSLHPDEHPAADDVAAEGKFDPRTLARHEDVTATVVWFHRDPAVDGLMTATEYRNRTINTENMRGDAERLGAVGEDGTVDIDAVIAAKADAERASKRRLLKLNKLALAAQEVRRAKLTEVLARKTLPKGTSATVSRFVATTMWNNPDLFQIARSQANTKVIAAELLGGDPIEVQAEASAERAQVITAAIVCAGYEANFPKDAWRQATESFWSDAKARVAYLDFLTEVFGYQLSEVEQVVAKQITAESIDLDS
ncbi:ParB/RepB/Spo0J family partition protein [Williamsia sp. MIQD14]|uniref:ParB/RepB/Spo0J family partition protein n=1 Tax=Williamsia sp. MIQD14 TaxID=3425703 RepID=UPI003DA177CD